ncbi:MAG TPA: addiction module protein [Longimicrobiaceae bacterium]|nr:addiction module protein [Longimicrobiaceae bacterium]
MGTEAERIEQEALQLSREERSRLATVLIASLDDDEGTDDSGEVQRAWDVEVRRRLADFDSDRTQPIPYAEVRAELRRIVDGG